MSIAPATLAEGPLGILGWHVVEGVTINDLTSGFPRIKLNRCTGLRDRPETDNPSSPNTGREGTTVYPGMARGRTIVYDAVLQAMSPIDLEAAKSALLGAWATNDPITITFKPPSARGGVEFFASVRILTCTIDDGYDQAPGAIPSVWQKEVILSVLMLHPWYYMSTLHAASETSGTMTVTNAGNRPTPPVLTITHSASNNVRVSNSSVGPKKISFLNLPGGSLVVDFGMRTAKVGGVSVINKLDDANTDWWDELVPGLQAGANTLTRTGGSAMTVKFFDAVA